VQGKAHQAKQDALDDKAAAWIFQGECGGCREERWKMNQPQPPDPQHPADTELTLPFAENNKTQPRGTIDLHGLFVKEAIEQVDKAIAEGQRSGAEELRVITGKGLHSARGQAKIKPAVEDLMRK
jgi:DNA-nicking Smr family endonuclease